MNLPDREGRFIARPVEWSVSEQGENNLATFIVKFETVQWFDDRDQTWYDVPGEIVGYFYMEKKDGTANERTIKSIREAFGWDGIDLNALHNNDWSTTEVQLTLENETWQGKTRLKVKWLNPRDYAGGQFERAAPETVKAIGSRLGAKLRALGGAPVGSTAPAGKPKAPPPPNGTKKPAPAPVATGQGYTPIEEEDIPF